MRLLQTIVLVKDISPTVSLSDLRVTKKKIDEAAHLILEIRGVVNPPILLRTGPTTYLVVDGHFEYYAALRARELDSERGETINAFVVESASEIEAFKRQAAVFRGKSR